MKKSIYASIVAIVLVILIGAPVAASYTATIVINNTSVTSYPMLGSTWTVDNASLVTGNYITASGLDVAFTSGGSAVPGMLVSDRTMLATASTAGQAKSVSMTTGNSPASSMAVIPGKGGYITTSDDAALEPAANFNVEVNGWIDTSVAGKYIVQKAGAMELYVSAPNELTGRIYGAGTSDGASFTAQNTSVNVYGVNWYTTVFACTAGDIINGVLLYVGKTGSPAGNFVVSLYATTAGVPSGSALATVSVAASTIGAAGTVTFTFTSAYLTTTTEYAIVCATPSGDVSNHIKWYGYNQDLSAMTPYSSANSGSTWSAIAAFDFYATIKLAITKKVVGTGIASGLHDIQFGTVSTNLKLYDGVTEKASTALAGVSTVGNSANFVWLNNDSAPYATFIKYSVGGNLIITYQPVTIISGTTLPDTTGAAQNGTFTFGANPSGVIAVTSGFVAPTSSGIAATVAPLNRPDFVVTAAPLTDNPLATGNPFNVAIDAITGGLNTQSGNPTLVSGTMLWTILWLILIEGAMVLCLKFLPNQIFGAVVGGVGFVAAWKFGSVPGWAFLLFVICAVGIITMEWKRGK